MNIALILVGLLCAGLSYFGFIVSYVMVCIGFSLWMCSVVFFCTIVLPALFFIAVWGYLILQEEHDLLVAIAHVENTESEHE
jgi:hypothetical protein